MTYKPTVLMTQDDKFKLQQKAIDALEKIKNEKHIYEQSSTKLPIYKPNKISYVLESYDHDSFSNKINHDIYYYKVLLNKLEDGRDKDKIINEIYELYDIINEIYKEIDTKPQVYGMKQFEGLTSSESLEKEAHRIISEHIDKNYYSMSIQERDKKYKDETINLANLLVEEEQIDIDTAVQLAQKKIILENLLNKVAFPLIVKGRLDEMLTESKEDQFFDNSRLFELYEDYTKRLDRLSLLLAAIV